METYKTRTGEEYVLCLVCNHPCFGGYASHIPCGGVKISELAKLRKNPFYESGKTPPHQITNMLDTTKAKERFIKEFTEPDYGWGSEGYTNKLRRVSQEEILAFLESELLLAHQAGREEMRQECLAAVPEEKEPVGEKNPLVVVINANNYGHNSCREQTIKNIKNIK